MVELLLAASRDVFDYPQAVVPRRHGPCGYVDYQAYKPWLRDEFAFRCVYCLTRERWKPDGQEGFSVEHVLPQATHSEYVSEYHNLLYVCCACNAYRQETPLPVDPRREALGRHVRVRRDGYIVPLSDQGRDFIDVCQLDRPTLTAFRVRMRALLDLLTSRKSAKSVALLRDLLGYPAELPDLARKRPPSGNRRADGIFGCYSERRKRGELSDVY
jgi:hypothetical protein